MYSEGAFLQVVHRLVKRRQAPQEYNFRSNEVRLWLSVIAYNLGNLWRRLLPKKIEKWPLTSLWQRLVRTGGRLVKHACYYCLLLSESHLTWRLPEKSLRNEAISGFPVPGRNWAGPFLARRSPSA